jgi:tetratricopeptide (TPR) repeat protein
MRAASLILTTLGFATLGLAGTLLTGPVLTSPALAQQQRDRQAPAPSTQTQPAEPQRRVPDTRHQSRLDQLFERLAASGNEAEAQNLSEQIARIWTRSGSDTLDLLMERVEQATKSGDHVTAIDILDSVLALKPDFTEAYSRRAAVHYQMKDMDAAMRDLRQTLQMEPRHFQALAGIGLIYQTGGEPRQALKAFREALKLNPHMKGIKQAAERLATTHDGQGI